MAISENKHIRRIVEDKSVLAGSGPDRLKKSQIAIQRDGSSRRIAFRDELGNYYEVANLGDSGSTGLEGPTGPQGATGASMLGVTGLMGNTGLPGDTGPVGCTGAIGETGLPGVTGLEGSTGPQGVTGSVGLTGSQGETGVQGETGLAGIQGVTGLMGLTGVAAVGDMTVETVSISEVWGFTGTNATSYYPITGLKIDLNLNKPSSVLSLLTLEFTNVKDTDHSVHIILNTQGYTSPEWTVNVPSGSTQDFARTLHFLVPSVPSGACPISVSWRSSHANIGDFINDASLSAIVLEGALGPTGIQGETGSIGIQGPTGAYGGPPGATGVDGLQGETGLQGVTGPGVAMFDSFEKILPIEDWRRSNVSVAQYGELTRVLEFDSTYPSEKIEIITAVPGEWNQTSDMTINVGILSGDTGAGVQAVMKMSYRGINVGDDMSSLGVLNTDTQTWTIGPGSAINEAHTLSFTVSAAQVQAKDYLFIRLEKVAGSPNMPRFGLYATELIVPTSVGMGPTGLIGITGLVGETGVQGETGAKGDTGVQGETGYQGETGVQGERGDTGVGFTGLQGATGIQGPQGVTGPLGPAGLTGSPGVQGITGYQGITGDVGLKGPVGDQGITGPDGVNGYTGTYNITVEGGTNVISTGTKANLTMPFDLVFDNWRVLSCETGTIYFSLYRGTYEDYPPSFNMHGGLTGPHIIDGIKNQSVDLSGWTGASVPKGGVVKVVVDGAQLITNATLSMDFHKA